MEVKKCHQCYLKKITQKRRDFQIDEKKAALPERNAASAFAGKAPAIKLTLTQQLFLDK